MHKKLPRIKWNPEIPTPPKILSGFAPDQHYHHYNHLCVPPSSLHPPLPLPPSPTYSFFFSSSWSWSSSSHNHRLIIIVIIFITIIIFILFHLIILHLINTSSSGGGVKPGGRMWTGERGPSPMWTSKQIIKIRVHRRQPVFFSFKEVGVFFTRISSLDGIKSWNFSAL